MRRDKLKHLWIFGLCPSVYVHRISSASNHCLADMSQVYTSYVITAVTKYYILRIFNQFIYKTIKHQDEDNL